MKVVSDYIKAVVVQSALMGIALTGCTTTSEPSKGSVGESMAATDPRNKVVPYQYVGGHLLRIPVIVNGSISTYFILDTGLGLNIISKSLCAKVGCVTKGSYTGKRMSGQEITVPLSSVASLTFGSKTSEQVPVGVFDLTDDSPDFVGIDGFLSLKYLESFAFTFDRNANAIVIEDETSLNQRLKAGVAVPINIKRDASTTGISLAMALPEGSLAKVEVDTGSDSLILDTKFMSRLKIKENHPSTKKVDGKDETGHTFARYFSQFSGSIHPEGAPQIAQQGVKVMFQKIIYDGLVGNSFLKLFTVTFDLPHSRMIFAPQR